MEKIHNTNSNHKKAEVAILLSDKNRPHNKILSEEFS